MTQEQQLLVLLSLAAIGLYVCCSRTRKETYGAIGGTGIHHAMNCEKLIDVPAGVNNNTFTQECNAGGVVNLDEWMTKNDMGYLLDKRQREHSPHSDHPLFQFTG